LRITTSNFIFQLNTCGYSPYVTSSLAKVWVFRLQLLLNLASAVVLGFESRGTHDHILLSQTGDSPQPGGPGPRIYISQNPRNKVAQLYLQALGSLFVASYDSQGYSGGIWTSCCWSSLYNLGKHRVENTAFNSFPIVALRFVAAAKCLPRRCLVTTTSFCSTIPTFSHHVTIWINWTDVISSISEAADYGLKNQSSLSNLYRGLFHGSYTAGGDRNYTFNVILSIECVELYPYRLCIHRLPTYFAAWPEEKFWILTGFQVVNNKHRVLDSVKSSWIWTATLLLSVMEKYKHLILE
jgi:hypothetical protein